MKINQLLAGSALALILTMTGCAVYQVVNSDYDRSADFNNYGTFAWLPDEDKTNTQLDNHIVRNNIKNYFTQEFMDEYKFQPDVKTPDLLMKIIITDTHKEKNETYAVQQPVMNNNYYNQYNYNNQYPANNYSNSPYYSSYPNQYAFNGMAMNNNMNNYNYSTHYVTEKIDYTQSTITLHLIDRVRNELVWSTTAEGDIYDNGAYDIENEIHPAVEKIMKYFPLKPLVNGK